MGNDSTMKSFTDAVNNAQGSGSEATAVDIDKLLPYERRGSAVDGKVQMFRRLVLLTFVANPILVNFSTCVSKHEFLYLVTFS